MDSLDLRLAKLRRLLARGATIRSAAAALGVPKTTAHRLAQRHKMPRRSHRLSAAKERQIARLARQGAYGVRRIAQETGVSPYAVYTRLIARLRKFLGDAQHGPCAPWRCSCGLKLVIRQCVRCGKLKPLSPRRPRVRPRG